MNDSHCKYIFLNSVNFLYFICGLFLVGGSISILTDSEEILISRLIVVDTREPIFYYVYLFVLILGLLVSILSTVGCWAIHTSNNCVLATYIFGVIVLLIGESVMGIVTTICPQYVGVQFKRNSLTEIWQQNYGVPSKDQYTVAIDLVQVKFECCGVVSGNDFSTSLWNLKHFAAPNLTVPISCCYLDHNSTKSFLDPIPIDLSLCQDISIEKYHNYRHYEGCFMALDGWLRNQKIVILFTVLVNVSVQLLILFGIISTCVKNKHDVIYETELNKPVTYMSHMANRKY